MSTEGKTYHAHGNKYISNMSTEGKTYNVCRNEYISNSRRLFDESVFLLNSKLSAHENIHVCIFAPVIREIPEKGRDMCI